MKLLAELRRRNVIRMAGLYLAGAWWRSMDSCQRCFPAICLPRHLGLG
jgi:hypothetical protein